MKRKNIIIILLCLSIFLFYKNVYSLEENGNYRILIEDDANLLTDEQENQLLEDMRGLSEFGNIAFKSIDNNYTSASDFARSFYHNNFGTSSGTLFLIDMDNREIYIFSDGYNYSIITNSKAYIITDNIYKYASNGNYYQCAAVAYSQMYTLLSGGKIYEPMRHISNGVLAIVCAFFINFLIVLLNSSIKKAKDKEIINNCDIAFSVSNIVGVKSGTHREYSPQSSSSSDGSFGGSSGGGGGGSSGGGGGHSF